APRSLNTKNTRTVLPVRDSVVTFPFTTAVHLQSRAEQPQAPKADTAHSPTSSGSAEAHHDGTPSIASTGTPGPAATAGAAVAGAPGMTTISWPKPLSPIVKIITGNHSTPNHFLCFMTSLRRQTNRIAADCRQSPSDQLFGGIGAERRIQRADG